MQLITAGKFQVRSFLQQAREINKRRFIDINGISQKYGENICEGLPDLHGFTGCDSVSALSGKGKQSAIKVILKQDERLCETMKELGQSYTVSEELLEKCEMYVCSLYGKSRADVNDVHFALFCQKGSKLSQLPPTEDALSKHTSRANYQAAIWRRASNARPDVPNPRGHGWISRSGYLYTDWMHQLSAPEAILELIHCNCIKSKCITSQCSCHANSLACTDLCNCNDGENEFNLQIQVSAEDDDSEIE